MILQVWYHLYSSFQAETYFTLFLKHDSFYLGLFMFDEILERDPNFAFLISVSFDKLVSRNKVLPNCF